MEEESVCPRCAVNSLFGDNDYGALNSETDSGAKEAQTPLPGYKIGDLIARGGMGLVYYAEHLDLKRPVAIKVQMSSLTWDRSRGDRFRMEAEAVAQLEHPNIVPIYDVGRWGGKPFIAMKWVEGKGLDEWLVAQRGDIERLSTTERTSAWKALMRQSVRMLLPVCHAIHHAHTHGYLHRDIKPSNVLIEAGSIAYVTDFGLARRMDVEDGLTITGEVLGTPSFMSPEQARGDFKELSVTSDVYSLGALLYWTLTGRPPFEGDSQLEVLRQIDREEPRQPSTRMSEVPRDLDVVCMKCLRLDPSQRYGSALELAQDLERWLRGDPVQARHLTLLEQGLNWGKRSPVVASLSITLVIACAAFVVFQGLSRKELRLERDYARSQETIAKEMAAKAQFSEMAERRHREAAERIGKQLAERLFRSRFLRADRELLDNDFASGTAQLTALLRSHPDNHLVWSRLMSALVVRQAARPIAQLEHDEKVNRIEFTSDGRHALTSSIKGRSVRLWDGFDGKMLWEYVHDRAVMDAAIRPDDAVLAAGYNDGTMRFWDMETRNVIVKDFNEFGQITQLSYSPSSKHLMFASIGNRVHLWNQVHPEPKFDLLNLKTRLIDALWVPGLERMILGSRSEGIFELNAETGELVEIRGKDVSVDGLDLSMDGRFLAITRSGQGEVLIWDREVRKIVTSLRHGSPLFDVEYSPAQPILATVSSDRKTRIWKSSGEWIPREFELNVNPLLVRFGPLGNQLLVGSMGPMANIWDTRSGHILVDNLRHPSYLEDARFSPQGDRLLTLFGSRPHAMLWGVGGKDASDLLSLKADGSVYSAAIHADGAIAAIGLTDKVRVLDLVTGRSIISDIPCPAPVTTISFHPHSPRLLAGCSNGHSFIYDIETRRTIPSKVTFYGQVTACAFSPDGKWAVTGAAGGKIELQHSDTGDRACAPIHGLGRISSIAFSPDGESLAVSAYNRDTRLWLVEEGELLHRRELAHPNGAARVLFDPDGGRLATVSEDGMARLWDVDEGALLIQIQHDDRLRDASWSSDGSILATSSADRTVRLWNSRTGAPVGRGMQGVCAFLGVRFSPEGNRLLTSDEDGAVRVWDVETQLPIWEPILMGGVNHVVQFHPDGDRLIAISRSGEVSVRMCPEIQSHAEAPDWFVDSIEAHIGARWTNEDTLALLPDSAVTGRTPSTSFKAEQKPFQRWVDWLKADPDSRGIPPFQTKESEFSR